MEFVNECVSKQAVIGCDLHDALNGINKYGVKPNFAYSMLGKKFNST